MTELREFARRYTAAWCSQNASSVAEYQRQVEPGVDGLAQTVLVCVFGATYFLDRGPRIIAPHGLAEVIGAALCAAGLVLMLFAFVSLGRAVQIAPDPRPDAHLVTRGIYARLRHPMYTAMLALVVGLFLRRPTVLIGIAAAIVMIYLVLKVRLEEKLLLGRYPEYAEYRRRSWGLFPGLRG
jgi:protein-S-isoprenylcysteine O-methyltransferase Ste14